MSEQTIPENWYADAIDEIKRHRARAEQAEAERDRLREALEQIAKARPTRGVPLKDTLEGVAYVARAALKRPVTEK